MKEIKTNAGDSILVDDEDFDALSAFVWGVDNIGYVRRQFQVRGVRGFEYMHRRILGLKKGDGIQADHINGNRLDNRKCNLRKCTASENLRNKKRSSLNTTGFKGVSRARGKDMWRAQIYLNKKQIYLGMFDDPKLAHEFYCLAADMIHGEYANHG